MRVTVKGIYLMTIFIFYILYLNLDFVLEKVNSAVKVLWL